MHRYALLATLLLVSLVGLISLRGVDQDWGDVSQALYFQQVRKYLLKLDKSKPHGKTWRPSVLLLINSDTQHRSLISLCNQIKKGGIFLLGSVVIGDFSRMAPYAAVVRYIYICSDSPVYILRSLKIIIIVIYIYI